MREKKEDEEWMKVTKEARTQEQVWKVIKGEKGEKKENGGE